MLKNLILISLLFSLLCSITAAQTNPQTSTPSWRTFTPEGKEFSVEVPGLPRHRPGNISEPGVSATFHFYYLATNSEVYVVGHADIPPSRSSMDKRLESGLSNMVGDFIDKGGKEISRRKATASFGCPGIIWTGSSPEIPMHEVHVFGAPERVYILMYYSRYVGQASSNLAARFFDSFKVADSPCEDKKPK